MKKQFRQVREVSMKEKVALVLVNFDLKLVNGEARDLHSIKVVIPTIFDLIKSNAKVIVLSHFGETTQEYKDENSLMLLRFELGRLLQKQVKFAKIQQCENSIKFMNFGEVLLLENLNFNPEEFSDNASKRKSFLKSLVSLSDIFINDAFGYFRKTATSYELPKLLKSYIGINFNHEMVELDKLKEIKDNKSLVIGGELNINELEVLTDNLSSFTKVFFYGEIASHLSKAIAKTEVSKDKKLTKAINNLLKNIKANDLDLILAKEFSHLKDKDNKNVSIQDLNAVKTTLLESKAIFWYTNGGGEKNDEYDREIALLLNSEETINIFKVASGDDTMYIIGKLKIKEKRFNLLSIGGLESLRYLTQKKTETIEVLKI